MAKQTSLIHGEWVEFSPSHCRSDGCNLTNVGSALGTTDTVTSFSKMDKKVSLVEQAHPERLARRVEQALLE